VEAADAAAEQCGWFTQRGSGLSASRYLKEVGDGFAAIVHVHPGDGARPSSDGWLSLGEGLEFVVSATYLPAERIIEELGRPRAGVEISDPDWDIDAQILTADRLDNLGINLQVTEAMTAAMAAAERFAGAHASPGLFAEAINLELEGEWLAPWDFVAAPAVFVAAGLESEARSAIDDARARTESTIPHEFWDRLYGLLSG
jgi:hypothetical protein